ncbi:hypothetical protein N0V90_012478 [Kalmusia sp. IMI 367209]|nr:hypothetical protein N0V90_012478 [Kalmusia sp. IMI 367209]
MPLKVIVVGAGVSGLCTAVGLHRAGHSVKVFDKSRFAGQVGSAVLITPNASLVLDRLGVDFRKARADAVDYFEVFDGISLAPMTIHGLGKPDDQFGSTLYTIHRADLVNELLRIAQGLDIQLGTKVVSASAEEGYVVLADGTKHYADLIVAADGVHSVLRTEVLEDESASAASDSGISTFRFMIPTAELAKDPELNFEELLKLRGRGCALFADTTKDSEHHMVWFTCQDRTMQVFVGIHDSIPASEDLLKQTMLEEFGHYHPSLIRMFKYVSLRPSFILSIIDHSSHRIAPQVTDWRLDSHPPLPVWHRGKIVLIGDAAHPMLPLGAQGANQAIEDAGALTHLLQNNETTARLPALLASYERVRRLRASRIQMLSKVRLGRESDVEAYTRLYADPPGSGAYETKMRKFCA